MVHSGRIGVIATTNGTKGVHRIFLFTQHWCSTNRNRGNQRTGSSRCRQAEEYAQSGFKVIGFFDDRNPERRSALNEDLPPFCGSLQALVDKARAGEIDTVLITLPMRAEKRISRLLDELADTTASAYIVPDFLFSSCSIPDGLNSVACRSLAYLKRRFMALMVGSSDALMSSSRP